MQASNGPKKEQHAISPQNRTTNPHANLKAPTRHGGCLSRATKEGNK